MFSFIFLYFTIPFVIIGYGYLSQKLIVNNVSRLNDIGIIGLFGFLFLYFLSNFLHFFTNINQFFISCVLILGICSFLYLLFDKNFKKIEILKFILLGIIFLPIAIISEPNEDYFFYHLPYMKYLESTKIIFGLVNINDILAYSTNSFYDIIVLFKFPFLTNNSSSIPILFFYIFFVMFLINKVIKTFDIFYVIILCLSILSFAKLRDFGTSVPPQLSLLVVGCFIYEIFINGFKEKNLTAILFLIVLAIILRFNSIIIFPLFILLFTFYFNKIIYYLKKNKLLIIYLLLIFTFFLAKNIIHSGCLIYPAHQLCFNNLEWSSNIKITEQKYNKLQSDAKGWPYYAKEKFNINKKFIWKNLKGKDFINYNQYSKVFPTFWAKYWIKDPNYKKIINIFLISLFIYFLLNIKSRNDNDINYSLYNKMHLLLVFSFISIFIWFYISPQMRYGGFFCFIYFFSLTIKYIHTKRIKTLNNINIILVLIIATAYVQTKNFNRIYKDYKNDLFINFPWPNYKNLLINKDYVNEKINNIKFNKRIYSNNLLFNNEDNFILMCGNIEFPCIPEGKEVCLGNLKERKKYLFYLHSKNKNKCYEFMNENILY